MESKIIEITPAAEKHGNLSLTSCGKKFFPPEAFGEPSAKKGTGKPIKLFAEGITEPIETDIPNNKNLFRKRAWVKKFVKMHSLNKGDTVELKRIDKNVYKVSPKKKTLTFIDLFAGIGGIRLAFEKAGCKCVFSSEWDKFAQQTYEANFGEIPHGDIKKIASSDIPDHDILTAGFPCQPFSISGVSKKKSLGKPHGFKDPTQGTLFFEIKRILKNKQPRCFLLENVKNLKGHDKGKTFKIITETLEKELGYTIFYDVINADTYVPQNRERIYIVGFKEPKFFSFPQKFPQKKPIFKDILQENVDKKFTLTDHLWDYLQKYAEKHKKNGNGFGFGMTNLNGRARTLSARYYKDGSEILIPQGKQKNPRRLTPRECANLMGFTIFKEDFKIPVSNTQAYKQFGNSVVVPVVYDIAKEMIKTLIKD